jgi:serine/threonine protein kinase
LLRYDGPVLTGTVAKRFVIQAEAGRGGMGAVYRALDTTTQRLVALKVLHEEAGHQLQRFAREAQLLSELNHPGVVRFIDYGIIGDGERGAGQPFLVMEWLDGESLSQRLERELLTIGETLVMTCKVAEALGAAHQRNVVHRDLKPGNIFLIGKSVAHTKVLDFGIASARGENRKDLTDTRTVLGTPGYMAPEQIQSSKHASPAADVFSLGCVMFKCLTGYIPYEGRNTIDLVLSMMTRPPMSLTKLRSDTTAPLESLLATMLNRDKSKRPQHGNALAMLIERHIRERAALSIESQRPPRPDAVVGRPTAVTRAVGGDEPDN